MNYSEYFDAQVRNYSETYNISPEEASGEVSDIIFNSDCDLLNFFC